MAESVLITGGAGFIGSHTARRLAEAGFHVILYDLRAPAGEAAWLLEPVRTAVTVAQGSIENWARLLQVCQEHRPAYVIHAAALVNPVVLAREPLEAARINLLGTLVVLEVARLCDVRRVVYFSSIGVLPRIQYEPVDARHPVILPDEGPGSGFYGAAKLAGEAFCFAYRQSFGLDFLALRPSAVYGLGMQWPIFIKPMVEGAVRGQPVRFAHGREFPRDYTSVKDVAQLAHRALVAPAARLRDRVFYAATGRPLVTAGQVAAIVRELIPGADIEIGPGLSPEDELEIRYRGRLSIASAVEQLGYQPVYADLRQGIADYIADFRAYLRATTAV